MNIIKMIVFLFLASAINAQTGRYIDFVGPWVKDQVEYPNGRREPVPYDQHLRIVITLDPNAYPDMLRYKSYWSNGDFWEEGIFWINPYTKGMCLQPKYNNRSPGKVWKWGYDDRGLKCFMTKINTPGYEGSWNVWKKTR